MTEHDKQSSGVEAAANVQPSQGRRRWVKGAMLAMPAVLTLRSGRLVAASSHCGNRATDTQVITHSEEDGTFTYVSAGRTVVIDSAGNVKQISFSKNSHDFIITPNGNGISVNKDGLDIDPKPWHQQIFSEANNSPLNTCAASFA